MSVDHKNDWQSAKNPADTFFDIFNIAFSHVTCHVTCNANAAQKRRLPHGFAKGRDCKCNACIASRNEYNAKWMATWRVNGKDKSRKNYQGL